MVFFVFCFSFLSLNNSGGFALYQALCQARQWKKPHVGSSNSYHWKALTEHPPKSYCSWIVKHEGRVKHLSSKREFHFDFMRGRMVRNVRNILNLIFNESVHLAQMCHFSSSYLLCFFHFPIYLNKSLCFNALSLKNQIKSRVPNMCRAVDFWTSSLSSHERIQPLVFLQ